MIAKPVSDVESKVADFLSTQTSPLTIGQVVERVQNVDDALQAAQVKVATMNLVSQGRASLDETWRVAIVGVK